MSELTYKRRTFEITLDFLIVGFALYLAFWAGFGLSLNETRLQLYLRSLPIAIVGSYLSVFLFGVYRGVWRYVGVAELVRYAEATVGAVLLTAMGVFILDSSGRIPILIWILFAIFLFLGLAASRSSFKVLDQLYSHQPKPHEERVLILGAGDTGEMALRWILMNPQFRYRPVGFLDEDPFNIGREIHGVSILGGLDQLQTILDQKQIDGVVLATDERSSIELIDKVVETCQAQKRWVRSLKLEFELLE
jgi:FlaA1/EpsC-like NDP-sugar epimerase